MNEKGFVSEKRFVSKKNLSRAWRRLFGKVLNSKEEIEANTSENMIAGAEAVKEVYSSLKANNNQIYMDYHDGKYGINTSSSRGADTFIPFRSDLSFRLNCTGTLLSTSHAYDVLSFNFTITYKNGKFDSTTFQQSTTTYHGDHSVTDTWKLTINSIEIL